MQLDFPTSCRNDEFRGSSGTKVVLSGFNSHSWRDLDTSVLKNEIEKHFELLLNRNQIDVSITLINGPKLHCLPYDYSQHEGEVYEDDLYQFPATRDKRSQTLSKFVLQEPIRTYLKVTKERDINRRPVIIAKGRRISEIKDIRSFHSKNKQTIWNHPNLTGYIDVLNFVSPTIARDDFRNDSKSKALFKYITDIENPIMDLIEQVNKASEQRHYRQLEDALNRALSKLARMDIVTMRYRTDIISGKGIALESGASGRDLSGDEGAYARGDDGDGHGGGGGGGGAEGQGLGISESPGKLPGGDETGDAASTIEAEDPYADTNLQGKEVRKSGFNVRIVDRPPDKILDERNGDIVEKRSILAGDTIEIFRLHQDFQKRISESRAKEHRITQRLITYLAGEMTVHYKDRFHSRGKQPEYAKWLFVDLTESIYVLEELLSSLIGKNLSDLS